MSNASKPNPTLPRIVRVAPLPKYRLHVEFDDGVAGTIDLAGELSGPVFEPLRNEALFRQVTIDGSGAVCWPNGPDLASDAMYDELHREQADKEARWAALLRRHSKRLPEKLRCLRCVVPHIPGRPAALSRSVWLMPFSSSTAAQPWSVSVEPASNRDCADARDHERQRERAGRRRPGPAQVGFHRRQE